MLNENQHPEASFDTITLLGVLQIFDDPAPTLANIRRWLRKGGQLLIHGIFNPFPLDVYVQYAARSGNGVRQKGWNIHSVETTQEVLTALGFVSTVFTDFSLPFDLPPKNDDPLQSWTEIDFHGNRVLFNGLNLRQPQFIVECLT